MKFSKVGENLSSEWKREPCADQLWDALQQKHVAGNGNAPLSELASSGGPLAMYYLAVALLDGRYGFDANISEGERWLRKSFDAGSVEAGYRLSIRNIRAGAFDSAETILLTLQEKYSPARYLLAWLYVYKIGDQDRVRCAMSLLKKNCRKGHIISKGLLGKILIKESDNPIDFFKGIYFYVTGIFEGFILFRRHPSSDRLRK
ncbi:MAG: hypothetical protein AAF494_05710 [Pseudomonadota bacterium]